MTDVVSRRGASLTLCAHGVDDGDFIEQITYLRFLKMADEQDIELPKGTDGRICALRRRRTRRGLRGCSADAR